MLAFESTNMHYAHALAVWGPEKQEPPAITSVDTESACRQHNRNVQRFASYKVAILQRHVYPARHMCVTLESM